MTTVLGSINMDLVANVSRLPEAGGTVGGETFATLAGGKGANQALAARRAGSVVQMRGAVGRDQFADAALGSLNRAGVKLTGLRRVESAMGTALILVDGNGENMIAVVPGANGKIGDVDAAIAVDEMTRGDHLLLQLEIPATTNRAALRKARAKGVVTLLNIAPLTNDAVALAQQADIVIANETEFERLAGQSDMDTATRENKLMDLHTASNQTLIVTLGADGVVAAHEGGLVRVMGLTINPVDTVGAGETFCGYLASGLDKGMAFEIALRRAAVAGSLTCLKSGAQPAIPTDQDVKATL